jgi:CubicO group peptidase (beta-lactamase class C family)
VPAAAPAPPAPPALTKADLDPFLDGLILREQETADIAGTVVVVVKDGEVLFLKGYGMADVKKKMPISAQDTLMRVGSVSKLFTWTAVMQLVEQGKLDLDRDVNGYLDFTIPPMGTQPITLRNLMTHTPGFEDVGKELSVERLDRLGSLGGWLKAHVPQRIFEAGTIPAYSNYGAALAGYIVERVSGRPFEQYVEEAIFSPLGITHGSFRQPLPAALQAHMAQGYTSASAPAKPFELIPAMAAGSLSITAADIARFMIAHLQDGRYGDARILQAATAQLMHARQMAAGPGMNGMALGFFEAKANGHRSIGHGGDTICFHSHLVLVPDLGLGLFVSSSGTGGARLRDGRPLLSVYRATAGPSGRESRAGGEARRWQVCRHARPRA